MRALTWQGNEHVEVTDVPDPVIQEPNDIIIRVTSTAICGSDLHLPLEEALHGFEIFRDKTDGCLKVVLRRPWLSRARCPARRPAMRVRRRAPDRSSERSQPSRIRDGIRIRRPGWAPQ